jgi:F0F1-type ATP synthase assembly protein I
MNNQEKKQSNQSTGWQGINLAFELGYTIAIPIVIFALGGRLLDKKLSTSPWLLLAGIFIALIISGTAVYWKTMKIISEEAQNSNVKNQNHISKLEN